MRVLTATLVIFGATSLPVAAQAKAKPQRPSEANKTDANEPNESAAARAARLALAEDTGALRNADLRASVVHVDIATPESNGPERTPSNVAEAVRPAGPLSGALEALVAKQVSRNESAFDRCVAEARARDPQLAGTVELVVNVAGKHATAQVVSGPTDAAFSTCVVQTAQSLKLSLPDLAFPWKLALGRATAPVAAGSAHTALP